MSDRPHASLRYTDDEGTQIDRSISNTSGIFPATRSAVPARSRLAANATQTLSPTLVMTALLGWSYDYVQWLPADLNGISKSQLGLSGLPAVFPVSDDILPAMTSACIPSGRSTACPLTRSLTMAFRTTFTWARGSHIIKFGGQPRCQYEDEIDQSENKGSNDFRPITGSAFRYGIWSANLLVARVELSTDRAFEPKSRCIAISTPRSGTWKVNRGLTLDYGVRCITCRRSHNTRPDETLDAVFVPTSGTRPGRRGILAHPRKHPTLIIDPANPRAAAAASSANSFGSRWFQARAIRSMASWPCG